MSKRTKSTISVSGTVEVDYDDEIDIEELTDDELKECIKEAAKRKIVTQGSDTPERQYTLEAYEELLGHRRDNALALLERALWPSKAAFTAPIDVMNAFHRKIA